VIEPSTILADAHVHFYGVFDLSTFLGGAGSNFSRAAAELGAARNSPALLLLTDGSGEQSFQSFRRLAGRKAAGGWRFDSTHEELSLRVADRDGRWLWLVAGRQIVVAENLEVLALGCEEHLPDHQPLLETIAAVRSSGGLVVIPWGVGKWWFHRGRLVESLIEEQDPSDFFLGDNGGRPRVFGAPRLFELARRRGVRILRGSDPLPFSRQEKRAGSCGFAVEGSLDPARPAACLKGILSSPLVQPIPFGEGERLLPFVRNQLAMQLRKRHPSLKS
jgi:hypothetical protein